MTTNISSDNLKTINTAFTNMNDAQDAKNKPQTRQINSIISNGKNLVTQSLPYAKSCGMCCMTYYTSHTVQQQTEK